MLYTLPDGSHVEIGPGPRVRAPEILFRPDIVGCEFEGVHDVLNYSIQKSDMDLRKVFYQNIVLSGGSTLFKGKFSSPTYVFVQKISITWLKVSSTPILKLFYQHPNLVASTCPTCSSNPLTQPWNVFLSRLAITCHMHTRCLIRIKSLRYFYFLPNRFR